MSYQPTDHEKKEHQNRIKAILDNINSYKKEVTAIKDRITNPLTMRDHMVSQRGKTFEYIQWLNGMQNKNSPVYKAAINFIDSNVNKFSQIENMLIDPAFGQTQASVDNLAKLVNRAQQDLKLQGREVSSNMPEAVRSSWDDFCLSVSRFFEDLGASITNYFKSKAELSKEKDVLTTALQEKPKQFIGQGESLTQQFEKHKKIAEKDTLLKAKTDLGKGAKEAVEGIDKEIADEYRAPSNKSKTSTRKRK